MFITPKNIPHIKVNKETILIANSDWNNLTHKKTIPEKSKYANKIPFSGIKVNYTLKSGNFKDEKLDFISSHKKQNSKPDKPKKSSKEQKQLREILNEKMRRKICETEKSNLNLTRALMISHVLYERNEQVKLNKIIKEHEEQIKDDEIKKFKDIWQGNELHALQREKNMQNEVVGIAEFNKNLILQKNEEKSRAKNEEIRKERQVRYLADQEMLKDKKEKHELNLSRKKDMFKYLKKARDKEIKNKKLMQIFERELYNVSQLQQNAYKDRDDDCFKIKWQKIMEKIHQNELIYNNYMNENKLSKFYQNNEENYLNLQEKRYREELNAKRDLRRKIKEEKIKNYQEDMEQKLCKENKYKELKDLELIEITEKIEAMKVFNEENSKKEKEKKKKYSEELKKQNIETRNFRKMVEELDRDYYLYHCQQNHDKFIKDAENIKKYIKEKEWPDYPFYKAIKIYEKESNIKLDNLK